MPATDETATIRPPRPISVSVEQHVVDPLLAGEVDVEDRVPLLGVHPAERLVPGDAGVVHHDVDAAVPVGEVVGEPGGRVGGGEVELQRRCRRSRWRPRPASSPAAGTSRQTTCAPSRASTWAIAAPMPRAAPVTSATWPASGRSQSSGTSRRPAPIRITWPETYAERADSRNRRVDSTAPRRRARRRPVGRCRPGRTPCRAEGEALQGPLGGGLAGEPHSVGRRAEHDHPAARASDRGSAGGRSRRARAGRSESVMPVASKTRAGGVRPVGGRRSRRRRLRRRRRAEQPARPAASRPPGAAPSRTGRATSGSPGLVPAQPRRVGQAEALDDSVPGRRPKLAIAIGHTVSRH